MKTSQGVYDFLIQHAKKGAVSFHMPGHKGAKLYKELGYSQFLDRFMDCDVTEIPGADNLFQTEGIIKEVQDRYAALYDVKKSYLLINGTSGGIIAAILASVSKGGELIMARNCHKSVFNALTLADAKPAYAYPEIIEEHGITGQIRPEEIGRLLKEHPKAQAVILPSPNYYGICSDIEKIAELVHRKNKILIVDQAHGAHLKFFNKYGVAGFPKSAEEAGADIVINSVHKTLASFTQSAVLNLNSHRVEAYTLEDKLQCIQSTSPSYLLMASLDIAAEILEEKGVERMEQWARHLKNCYSRLEKIKGVQVMEANNRTDWTKINFSMKPLGLSGNQIEELLMEEDVFVELTTGDLVMCMSGIGNSQEDFERLAEGLEKISEKYEGKGEKASQGQGEESFLVANLPTFRQMEVIPKNKKIVSLEDAEDCICAASIIPYPPGIPLVCPGERLDRDTLKYIKLLRERGEKVIGVTASGGIAVGRQ